MSADEFLLDSRLASSCFFLADWPLSRILLKNNRYYPWLILVPRRNNISEINQLIQKDRHALIDEIASLSAIIENYFKPKKLNVASLGNIVSQLHVHLVARQVDDASWPYGIWQNTTSSDENYAEPSQMIQDLCEILGEFK